MNGFSENVFEVFDVLQTTHRFLPARATSNDRFAALVRSEADDVFTYVFVHDGRAGDVNLDVDLWLAPPNSPDDALDNLYVGYKIRIGSEFDVDDEFFLNCQRRIIHLLPYANQLVPAVRLELASPAFSTRRLQAYRIEREALATLLNSAKDGNEAAREALHWAHLALLGDADLDTLKDKCVLAAGRLMELQCFSEKVLEFCDNQVSFLASALSGPLYAYALGEASSRQ